MKFVFIVLYLASPLANAVESVCYGSTAQGRLEYGVISPLASGIMHHELQRLFPIWVIIYSKILVKRVPSGNALG